jgi:3-methyl-2-oxobutanoate hydroxymethyltransferase
MPRLTIQDLQQMKRDGKKIAAGVCYEAQMATLFERAGVDLLSVGDSLSRAFLGYANPLDYKVEEMLTFGGAVARTAKRAAVSIDVPDAVLLGGPKEMERVARIIKETIPNADMIKVDIREREEELIDEVQAVIEAGLHAYPQIGFEYVAGGSMHDSPADLEATVEWALEVERRGASMIDLTMVSKPIYAATCAAVKIPVIGGQTGNESDGKIYVGYAIVGYQTALLDKADAGPSAVGTMYDVIDKAVAAVHDNSW